MSAFDIDLFEEGQREQEALRAAQAALAAQAANPEPSPEAPPELELEPSCGAGCEVPDEPESSTDPVAESLPQIEPVPDLDSKDEVPDDPDPDPGTEPAGAETDSSEEDVEQQAISYSRGRDKFDAWPEQLVAPCFAAFAEIVLAERSTAKGLTWISGPFAQDEAGRHHRCRDGALPRRFLPSDLDGSTPEAFVDLCTFLSGFRGFAYTTSSHTNENPHARFVLELSRSVTREEGMRLGAAMQRLIEDRVGAANVALDPSVYRAEQPVYGPLTGAETMRYHGDPVEVDAVLALAPAEPLRERPATADSYRALIIERGLLLRQLGPGKDAIVCPFSPDHSEATSDSSTAYFWPLHGGYKWGRIHCLHAHCADRKQEDYIRALGADPREVWRAQVGGEDLPPVEPYGEDARRHTAGAKAPEGETRPGNGAAPGDEAGSASGEESRLNAVEIFIQSDDTTKPPRPRPQTDILIDIGLKVSRALFCGDDDRAYAVIRDRAEVWGVASKRFREWLRGAYFKRIGKGANANSVRDAVETIAAKAQFSGDRRKVFLRTAEADGKLYVDLTDDDWRVVEIDRDDWRVLDQAPVMFTRRGTPKKLLAPEPGGSLCELWPFLNVPEKSRPLVAGWLLAALYPSGPYPILVLQGEEGTAKSTTARMLRSLCDPSMVPLRPPTRDERDFLVGAVSNWCVCIDNVSDMQPWLSDALCRLSTGGGFAARTLYTDCDETAIQIQRPVIMNGIDVNAYRGDLVSRTITVGLEMIPEDKRVSEAALLAKFEKARPRILGALFTALSQALREKPNVRLTRKPRMADFATLAVAAETALGFEPDEFMATYAVNIASGAMTSLEASPVAQAIITLMSTRKQDMTGHSEWVGTATELLDLLAPKTDDHSRSASAWPRSGRGMTGALTRFAPALRRIGIHVEHLSRSDAKGSRRLRIAYGVPAQSSEPSDRQKSGQNLGGMRVSVSDGSNRSDNSIVRESGNRQRQSEKNTNEFNVTDVADVTDGSAGPFYTPGHDLPGGDGNTEERETGIL